MSRFVTPSKVALLVLIDIYVDGVVYGEALVPVLSFITSQIMPWDPPEEEKYEWAGENKADRTFNTMVSIKDFERLLASYPFLLGMPGRGLWDRFVRKLWKISSLDGMTDFFDSLPARMLAVTKEERRKMAELGIIVAQDDGIKFTKHSPVGTFVRRSCMEYHRLNFHTSTDLWKNFIVYRQPTEEYLSRKLRGLPRLSFDSVLLVGAEGNFAEEDVMNIAKVPYGDLMAPGGRDVVPVSVDDVEVLLEFQLEKLQKFGTRVTGDVQDRFEDMLNRAPLIPSTTFYVQYLDAWRSGDYPSAFDCLYRYFDYTLQIRDRMYYQYALMNLAILHADFGCYQDALSAMLESVATARENQDLVCLNFALNWLYNFGRVHPDLVQDFESRKMMKTGVESLAYLRIQAREMGMWTLWSAVMLSEARIVLTKGGSVATALEWMVRSSHVMVEKNTPNMFCAQLSMTAALWSRLGQGQLAIDVCETFLRCNTGRGPFDDVLRMMSRLAMLWCARGKYDETLQRLEEGIEENELRVRASSHYWARYRGIIKLQRDLCRNNVFGAERLLEQLLQGRDDDDLEPDVTFMIDSLHIDCLKRRGNFQAAFAKLESMGPPLKDDGRDVALKAKLLLLKVSLLSAVGRPQRAFSAAVQALDLARRARLMSSLWQAAGALSLVLVSLGEFAGAVQLASAVLPRSLECESAPITGELYAVLGDAYMGLAGQHEPVSAPRVEYLREAAFAVQMAHDQFASIGDVKRQCTLMAKKAVIMRVSGDEALAEDCAAAYVALQKKSAEALRGGGLVM